MFHTVARLGVPYILMHLQGTPRTMQDNPHYDDPVAEVIEWLARRVQRLRELGAHDLILDPGFGFGKTLEHNYALLDKTRILPRTRTAAFGRCEPEINDLSPVRHRCFTGAQRHHRDQHHRAPQGAHILRVHDVRAAVEAVRIVEKMRTADHLQLTH